MRSRHKRQGGHLFPQLYHAHHSRHSEDLPFWLDLSARCGGPILELGCGTGRVMQALARAGHTVFGLDNDWQMLAALRQMLSPELLPKVHIFQGDMSAYHLSARFTLIILPCNTLSTLPAATRQPVFDLAYRHLRPGGVFAASLPNPALLRRLPAHADSEIEEVFPHPADGEPVQVSSEWQRSAEQFTVFWHYDHLLPDGSVERTTAEIHHLLSSGQEYLDELFQAGFEPADTFGDFMRKPYRRTSSSLVLVAKRQEK